MSFIPLMWILFGLLSYILQFNDITIWIEEYLELNPPPLERKHAAFGIMSIFLFVFVVLGPISFVIRVEDF